MLPFNYYVSMAEKRNFCWMKDPSLLQVGEGESTTSLNLYIKQMSKIISYWLPIVTSILFS